MMTDEQRELAEKNMALVTVCLKKYVRPPKDSEYCDYFQEGCIGLCKAAIYFNPDLGYTFSTYAMSMIIGEVKRYKRDYGTHHDMFKIPRRTRDEMKQSFEDALLFEESDYGIDRRDYNKLLIDLDREITNSENGSSTHELIEDVRLSVSHLSDIEAWDIIERIITSVLNRLRSMEAYSVRTDYTSIFEEYIYSLIYGEEKLTQVYLAKKYETSQAQIHRIINKCMEMMKEAYEREVNR